MASPDGNTESSSISDPNPNPNPLDVAAPLTQMPANSPDARDELSNLSSMPTISVFIAEEVQKAVKDLYGVIEATTTLESKKLLNALQKSNYEVMKLKKPKISDAVENYISQNFVAMLQESMVNQITVKVLEDFQEVLEDILVSKRIREFERACEDTISKKLNATFKKTMNQHVHTIYQQVSTSTTSLGEIEGKLDEASTTISKVVDALRRHNVRMKHRAGLSKHLYETVFVSVLDSREDLTWLCSEVDPDPELTLSLTQSTLVKLICALTEAIKNTESNKNETSRKLLWMLRVVPHISPYPQMTTEIDHIFKVFTDVHTCLAGLVATGEHRKNATLIRRMVNHCLDRMTAERTSAS